MNHPHLYSISFLILVFMIIIINHAPRSLCADDKRFTTCDDQLFRCGALTNTSYPFWGGNRPQYCGHPGFNLSCQGNVPLLKINSTTFRVLQIDTSAQTLTVARKDFWNDICPSNLYNATLDWNIFSYSSDISNLTMYYGCPLTAGTTTLPRQFTCTVNGNETNSYFEPYLGMNNPVSCSSTIILQVSESAASEAFANTSTTPSTVIEAAIEGGFGVVWQANNAVCNQCEASGGRCGYNDTNYSSFTCYCADQPYPLVCSAENQNGSGNNPGGKRRIKGFVIILIVISTIIGLGFLAYILCSSRMKAVKGGAKKKFQKLFDRKWKILPDSSPAALSRDTVYQQEGTELPIFSLEKIAAATNNFSVANKLGEGGFGPVYKGKLPNGQELAVKRLSKSSGQGIEEFRNEVLLISKLQHRNLVKLIGFCIEGEEKLLLYEFMPNSSLDAYLFGSTNRTILNWDQRYNITEGIARGLLYLHRDSRLTVIHRDLKTSNILLDEDMNPKISDFGMARIVVGNQTLANTNRVVGTFGYMSPEYVIEGTFSEKSDVFSFGVLLLEIVSGKRNTGFYHHETYRNLLGYAWHLWNTNKALELLDSKIADSISNPSQVMRCIHVGLLCVQEHPNDRPSMATIVSMLCNDTTLPTPTQPAFILERNTNVSNLHLPNSSLCSLNYVSITNVEGR